MKIGIMTFHSALNVGAVLQAYCLQTCLVNLGHAVEFINYQPLRPRKNLRKFIGKGFRQTFHKWKDEYYTHYYNKDNRFNFILKEGKTKFTSLSQLKSTPPDCDLYIAGSDQIWNFGFSRLFDEAYFLAFGDKHIRRVAFAASLGQNLIPEEFKESFARNIERFDLISVREKNSIDILAQLIEGDKKIEHISDPTFLLSLDQFELIEEAPVNHCDYIVSYMLPHYELGTNLERAIYFVQKELSLELINLKNPNTGHRLNRVTNKVVTPSQWLGYIKNSSFTICCSFHVVVFSLIYKKPFIVVTPYKNNRIISLLEAVGLVDRCIYDFDVNYIKEILTKSIDWNKVDKYFIKERDRSMQFLQEALGSTL